MSIFNIISLVVLGLLMFGFLVGLIRSFRKSTTRFVLVLITFLVALFCSPLISNLLITNFVSDYTFNGFGLTFDFKEIVANMAGEGSDVINDVMNLSTTNSLILNIINVVMNFVAFLLLFLVGLFLTLIIYWIINGITKHHAKKKGTYEKMVENKKKFSFRLLGGLFGILAMSIFCFALTYPIFGISNLCDKFVEATKEEQVASAADDSLFENSDNNSIKEYTDIYVDYKSQFDESILGKIVNTLGINKLGVATFDHLTTTKQGGVTFDLTEDLTTFIKIYDEANSTFLKDGVTLNDKESVDKAITSAKKIFTYLKSNDTIKNLLVEVVSTFRTKMLAGESYFGFTLDTNSEYYDYVKEIVDKGFNTTSIDDISANVDCVFEVAKLVNDAEIIDDLLNNRDVLSKLQNNKTLIKNIVVEFSKTKIKNALPKIFPSVVEMLYDKALNTEGTLTKEQIHEKFANVEGLTANSNWEQEGQCLQNIANKALAMFGEITSGSKLDLTKYLADLGYVIDQTRTSLFSDYYKIFITDFVDSKIDAESFGKDAKNTIKTNLNNNWNSETFSFENLFGVIQSSLKLTAKNLSDLSINEVFDTLGDTLAELLTNEATKKVCLNLISGLISETESASIINSVKEIFTSFLNNSKAATLEYDINAGKEIFNIMTNKDSFLGEDSTKKTEVANKMINTIIASPTIMTLISNEDKSEGLQSMVQSLESDDIKTLKNAIKEQNIAALKTLFGIEDTQG